MVNLIVTRRRVLNALMIKEELLKVFITTSFIKQFILIGFMV